jgi:hypothetical protein
MLNNVSDIFPSQNEKNKKITELLRWYVREKSVISKDWGISASAYVWMLNDVSDIFSSQKEKNKKRTELLRWYARDRSVISKDWGVSAAILWLQKKSDVYRDFPADLVVQKYILVLV